MKSYHVILDGQLYRLTRESYKRLLLAWARSGERPDFSDWKGVKAVGRVPVVDDWTLLEVETALLDWLRAGRDVPAQTYEKGIIERAIDGDPVPLIVQPMGNGTKLLQIVDESTGEIKASSLTPRQAERMLQEGVA